MNTIFEMRTVLVIQSVFSLSLTKMPRDATLSSSIMQCYIYSSHKYVDCGLERRSRMGGSVSDSYTINISLGKDTICTGNLILLHVCVDWVR